MDTHKDDDRIRYRAYSIPSREQLRERLMENKRHNMGNQTDRASKELEHDPFAEIEINQDCADGETNPVPLREQATPVIDEERAQFYSMRQIARGHSYFTVNHSEIFYRQALFMKDFEDDYGEQEPFSSYYPYYQQMSYGQLRTYFTWRTQVRKGNITNTSASYAFLYIYELLNHISVDSPKDGLDQLMAFWQSFRCFDRVIDRYVLQWIKDYHVYYPLEQSFEDFVRKHDIWMYYPTVFGYESGQQESFDLFSGISSYDIKKSVFYSEQTCPMLRDCFYFILDRFRELCGEKNKCFEDFIFYPLLRESAWTPFDRALFYPVLKQPDRQVVISSREIYRCRDNHWMYRTVILSEQGRRLIGYMMKEMEAALRQAVRFKHKISANVKMCGSEVQKMFELMGIPITRVIQEGVLEFYALFTRKIITVDMGNLDQIRQEALLTQEKLIVPEDGKAAAPPKEPKEPENMQGIEIVVIGEQRPDEKVPDQKAAAISSPVSAPWAGFKDMLTPLELEALKLALENQDVKGFAAHHGMMLEVLADGINQKAMDCVGDTLLEVEDSLLIYEEYREKLMEMEKYQ